MKRLLPLGALVAIAAAGHASDLNLSVESGGQTSISVLPGATINFELVAELSDAANLGLAGFTVDLSFDGGALAPVSVAAGAPMNGFDLPLGLTNPAGYGGTVVGGDLIQIGGAQNTIVNFIGNPPTGSVTTGVASPGVPQVLATGTLTVPMVAGTYTLDASNLRANTIRSGEDGNPFWACDEAGEGTVVDLTIDVIEVLSANLSALSVGGGGSQLMFLDAGAANAARAFLILGSASGVEPGIPIFGLTLPLNPDFYLSHTASNANLPPLTNSFGLLDVDGKATAAFTMPASLPPSFIGLDLHHAYVLLAPEDYISNPVLLQLTP